MSIPLIDHVRHWGKQISPIWAKFFNLQTVPIPLIEDVRQLSELFDLQNVPIPLIDNVRHWGEQISVI